MGCCESVAISVKSEERSVSLSKKEAEKNRQTEAAKARRADQTTTENVVHEEFERGAFHLVMTSTVEFTTFRYN